jgi:membrane glycosyltransferase
VTYQARQSDIAPGLTPLGGIRGTIRPNPIVPGARRLFFALTLGMTLLVATTIAFYMAEWTVWSMFAMALALPSLVWISGGAATALTGLICPKAAVSRPAPGWKPASRTAVLLLVCREDPDAIKRNLSELVRQIRSSDLAPFCDVIVLSDTFGAGSVAAEEAALSPLIADELIKYRRRSVNTGRKPGNIAEWFDREGRDYGQMLVLDADSRMTGARLARMLWWMETQPGLGLLQAGMALLPARSRFGQIQRTASRLLGPPFGSGLAAWTGNTANYWGHNALIRTAAFAEAAHLPRLSGSAPFGGDILSHDFIEAALIRRTGWEVAFDPDTAGSAEDGPQDMASFHRRNRRWCQGNLQHIRLIAAPGLHLLSRLHIASGIFSFLAAPVWLALVVLMGSGLVVLNSGVPFVLIIIVLLLPKLSGLWRLAGARATPWRRRVGLRAFATELLISSLLAPIVMLHHTTAVLAVLMGRDCGWKRPTPKAVSLSLPKGLAEAAAGFALVGLVVAVNQPAALWLLPVAGPMIAAPLLIRWMDSVTKAYRPE